MSQSVLEPFIQLLDANIHAKAAKNSPYFNLDSPGTNR